MITLASGQVLRSRKLNIGCGYDRMDGYVNVDLQDFHAPDLVADALNLVDLPSGAFEEIQARDVLEHFKWKDTPRALLEWNRLLQDGGRLYLSTTYLPGLLHRMSKEWFGSLESHRELVMNLFSMQAYEGDFHLSAFTEKLIRHHLWAAGFTIESLEIRDGWLFNIWAAKAVDYGYAELLAAQVGHAEFVAQLYPAVLSREADAAGADNWTALLDAGERTRAEVLKSFLVSAERDALMESRAPVYELTVDPS